MWLLSVSRASSSLLIYTTAATRKPNKPQMTNFVRLTLSWKPNSEENVDHNGRHIFGGLQTTWAACCGLVVDLLRPRRSGEAEKGWEVCRRIHTPILEEEWVESKWDFASGPTKFDSHNWKQISCIFITHEYVRTASPASQECVDWRCKENQQQEPKITGNIRT